MAVRAVFAGKAGNLATQGDLAFETRIVTYDVGQVKGSECFSWDGCDFVMNGIRVFVKPV